MKILVSAVLAGALAQPMMGCDLCAIYSASHAQGETGKGIFAGLAEQFTYFGTVQVDGHEVDNPSGQHMNSWISQVYAGYNFTDWAGVQDAESKLKWAKIVTISGAALALLLIVIGGILNVIGVAIGSTTPH